MIYKSWNGLGFRKTNRHSNHGLQYPKVGTQLVFAKPTVIPTVDFKIRKLERSWFSQIKRHSNLRLKYTKVGTRLVFANPTVNPTVAAHV